MTLHDLDVFVRAHWPLVWPILSALLVLVLRARTPEAWVALGERHPRVQGAIRLLRALGLDPVKAVSALVQVLTGRADRRVLDTGRESMTPPEVP
jgi:hypothetical protein